MLGKTLLTSLFLLVSLFGAAQKIRGLVTDTAGDALPFSSITIKGEGKGTIANAAGLYSLQVKEGTYSITCQHVGFRSSEKVVKVDSSGAVLDFQLSPQELTLSEVVVTNGEDPAYPIIREAVRKRPHFQKELQRFEANVYTKGVLTLRDYPKSIFGRNITFLEGDTAKSKTLYLSESIARYSVEKPKDRVEVMATRVSGQTEGFGLSTPAIISFYDNHISIGEGLAPRGFLSPIGDRAFYYYRFKYEGAFFEAGREVNRIRVIPKRKYEPLFSGYINIVEGEWRIHSLALALTRDQGLGIMDSLKLEQLYVPQGDVWTVRSQVIYPALKIFSFDAAGSFVNVYSDYNLEPRFPKGFFNATVLQYRDSSNQKPLAFWEESRPLGLQKEEADDYRLKDSLEQAHRAPAYLDSIDRRRNKLTPAKVFLRGVVINKGKSLVTFSVAPLIQTVSYNTVEGWVLNPAVNYSRKLDSGKLGTRAISFSPQLRYGFSNRSLSSSAQLAYTYGKKKGGRLSVSGGKNVFQFNNAAPVDVLFNTISTLTSEINRLKIYGAYFFRAEATRGLASNLNLYASAEYQDRYPLENTSTFTFRDYKDLSFTPNYPIPLADRNIGPHRAFILRTGLRWQPGLKYVEFPDQKLPLGSNYPVLSFSMTHALKGVLEGDVDYSKWNFNISQQVNLKLYGKLGYQVDMGGFLATNRVEYPDYLHFRGFNTSVAASFNGTFQLVPVYYFSNASRLYAALYTEHHFNGFITNKLPLLRKWKWNLVGGLNAIAIKPGRYYAETFVGLENIFGVFRIDYVTGFEREGAKRSTLRFGMQTPLLNRQ